MKLSHSITLSIFSLGCQMKKYALGYIEFSPNQVIGHTAKNASVFAGSQPKNDENLIQAVSVLGEMQVDDQGLPMHTRDAYFRDCTSNTHGKFNLGASPLTNATVLMAFKSGEFEEVEPSEFPEPDNSKVHVLLAKNSPCLITHDSDKAFKAQKHLNLDPSVSLSKVRDQLRLSSMVRIIDDNSWPTLAAALLADAGDVPDRRPMFSYTPKDLPGGLAQQRLYALEPFLESRPENTETAVELMEVLLADWNNRSINFGLIRQSSIDGAHFSSYTDDHLDDLGYDIDSLMEDYHDLVSKSPTPASSTDSDVAIARTQIAAAERLFAYDRHPDNSEGLRLG